MDILPLLIIIGVLLVFCYLFVLNDTSHFSSKKRDTQQLNTLKEQGLTVHATFPHVNGLPIAENLLCKILSFPNRIEFKSGTTSITLIEKK